MSDTETRYHESWLGMVQPVEGLVFSVPVLVDAGVMVRNPPDVQERFRAHLTDASGALRVRDLVGFFRDVLGFTDAQLGRGDAIPRSLSHYVPEGKQLLEPSLVVWRDDRPAEAEPKERAAMLVWQLPDGLPFDKNETTTGAWEYPPQHKLDRLLRGLRVPVGLLANGEAFRLVYAPHGESTGALTFRVEDMASVGGRPILDAFLSLLSAHRFFGVAEDRTLRALLDDSRKRQANVTNELAGQVFEALDLLLRGFEAAAERDGTSALRDALQDDDRAPGEHVYGGLLTAMLRLVFLLYAEDKGLMPMAHPVYAKHLSVLGLFDQLQQDAGMYPDTMGRRFGAWPRLLALFRAVYEGVSTGEGPDALLMPARRGKLFDPNEYPFLEGWTFGGAAPHDVASRGQVRVPSLDDETVSLVLEKLLLLDGQRLSYRALDVEQIGSVYEALMGYSVVRLGSPAVCLRDSGVWLEAQKVVETQASRREALVVDESGLSKSRVAKVGDALKAAKDADDVLLALEPLRKSPRTIPVRPTSALVLQPGHERRRTSSHYTPRSLSAPIVEKTLRPLLNTMAANGRRITADQLLELKVCDPAMGSGAFLVEACRFLAEEVVRAWMSEGKILGIEKQHGDPVVHARRLVAQRCLYGVDKNPYAVTLAKLSLWLVSFSVDEPFTFVDHALRWGDSLVGLSLEQLRRFHWKADGGQADFIVDAITRDLDDAMHHRKQILAMAKMPGVGTAKHKEQLLREAEDSVRNARLLADVLVGAFFAREKDKERENERLARLTAAQQWKAHSQAPPDQLLEWQREMRRVTPPFHWPIEFPEVFYAERPDPLDENQANRVAWMDAFVGNPPFMHGLQVARAFGSGYVSWITAVLSETDGRADLCAHFFVRCAELLGANGAMGLIATNTIAQGDTRVSGLANLLRRGLAIFDATTSFPWPGDAAVVASIVHMATGAVVPRTTILLDGNPARAIDSSLRAGSERAAAVALASNAGRSFLGSHTYGSGFVMSPQERDELLNAEPSAQSLVFPYVGGEDLNSSPRQEHRRYVINFGDRELQEAEAWPFALAIVRERVKPYRDGLKETALSAKLQRYWWRFYSQRSELYAAIRSLKSCLANSQVSKHLVFARQPTDRVFAHTTYVFAYDDDAHFAVMQSRVHEPWARLLSSSLEDRLRYAPSDCFETFPFPRDEKLAKGGAVDAIGEQLYAARAKLMVDADQGLTTTYNQLKDPHCTDPRILDLRKLHEDMDRAVLDAYGWTDIQVPPYCPMDDDDKKQVEAFEDEVIDRLFALNAERAKEEALLGLSSRKGGASAKKSEEAAAAAGEPAAPKKKAARKKKVEPEGQGGLF